MWQGVHGCGLTPPWREVFILSAMGGARLKEPLTIPCPRSMVRMQSKKD